MCWVCSQGCLAARGREQAWPVRRVPARPGSCRVPRARLALEAARRQDRSRAEEPAGAWVTYLPAADFVDVTAWFAPGQERLESTPDGLPGADEEVIRRAQQAIGTRVERLLTHFAFEAAARKEKTFLVTNGQRFTEPVQEGLLRSLPIGALRGRPG